MDITSREQGWRDRADALAQFIADNGRGPEFGVASEKSLYDWLMKTRHWAATPTKHFKAERAEYLDGVVPGWRAIGRVEEQTDLWFEQAAALTAFYAEHRRWPSMVDSEMVLFYWLANQRHLASTGATRLTPERTAHLNTLLPGWRATGTSSEDKDGSARGERRRLAWFVSADTLAAFRLEHGRWPRYRDLAERPLTSWLTEQRMGARTGNPVFTKKREAYLNKVLPDWRGDFEQATVLWKASAHAIAALGRWPHQTSDVAEAKLYMWLATQCSEAKSGAQRFTKEREIYLDTVIPGWRDATRSFDARWKEQADGIEALGRWPRYGPPEERAQYDWFMVQRKHAKSGSPSFTAERRAHLTRVLPGWDASPLI